MGSDDPTKQYGGCSQHLYLSVCVCVCGSCQQVFIEHHPYNEWSASCPAVAQLNVTATRRKEVNEHECTWSQWHSVQSEYLPEAPPPHPELQPPPHKTSWQTNTQNSWQLVQLFSALITINVSWAAYLKYFWRIMWCWMAAENAGLPSHK